MFSCMIPTIRIGNSMPEIFQYEFMNRAIVASVLVGVTAPAIGMFLVLRRLSLIADTLSHVAFAGVAVALITKSFTPIVAFVATATAAVSIEELRVRRLLPGDAALAVFLYGALALAVVLISASHGFNTTIFSYLFGSLLSVSTTDLWWMGSLALVIVFFLFMFRFELTQITFDPDLAKTNGVRVHMLNISLAILTAGTITVSMRVVGVLLVGALIVIPVLVSIRVVKGLTLTLIVSSAIGVFVGVFGMVISFYADLAPGGTVVLIAISLLIIVEIGALIKRSLFGSSQLIQSSDHTHAHEFHAHGANENATDDRHSHR